MTIADDSMYAEAEELREQLQASQEENQRLAETYRRERECHAANLKEQQKCEAQIERLTAGIKKVIADCDGCGGQGFNVTDDGQGDIDKDPCNSCWDLRELVQDHTDYTLEREVASSPALVNPAGTIRDCQKSNLCPLNDGHDGECELDIPF